MIKIKWIRKILSIATVLLMIFALAPTKVEAQVNQVIYNADGIHIYVDTKDGAIEKNVNFTVNVDGVNVANAHVEGLPAIAGGYYVQAPGYDVSFEGVTASKLDSIDEYLLTFGSGTEHNVTINLTKSNKTSDVIPLGYYGTFYWQKGEATHDDYERQVSVYVNDSYAQEFTIYTPQQLNNSLGSNAQYWFEPSGSYNAEYSFDHPYALDMAANQNLAIYLTTKCPCGNQYCECPGGADCTCQQGCNCELCNPTQGENEIRTHYGVIEYKQPTGEGYNLTVEIYVNGKLEQTTDQLRIKSGENNCLNFSVASGYYYHDGKNGYDIITGDNGQANGASWTYGTGYISIDPAYRDSNNILKIYLWSYDNHAVLDVTRHGDSLDNVTGYIISYQAKNPATGELETYTYNATSFIQAQPQIIPINTDVTITAICNSPYEVAQWSTADAWSTVNISGRDGQQGPEAYGNSATINVTSTAYPNVEVMIDELREVKVPSEEELVNNSELYFEQGAVTVDCTSNESHDSSSYKLKENTFEISGIQGDSASGYYATVTITDPDSYIDEYNQSIGVDHVRSENEVKTIKINYQGYKNNQYIWKAEGSATYNVECENGEEPEGPTNPEIEELLKDNAVTVKCINETANHDFQTYGLKEGYTVSEVQGDADAGYTVDVTVTPDIYVQAYVAENGEHTLSPDTQAEETITLEWTNGAWVVKDGEAPVTYTVVCEDTGEEPGKPDKPTLEKIDELLPDTLVSVDCITDENHADQTYNLIESAITIGDVEGDADKQYTSTVTFAAKGYVDQYSRDMKKDHTLAYGQPTEHKLVFVWDAANQKWQLSIDPVTPLVFQVECDTTTEPGTDEPGTEDPENPDDEKPGDDQQGTENPDDQKPGDQDGQGTGDKTDGSQDGDKNGGADSGKQDSTKGDGTKTSASLGVSLFGSLASVSATGAAILSVLRRKRR